MLRVNAGAEAKQLADRIAKLSLWVAGAAAGGLVIVPAAALGWASGNVPAALVLALALGSGLLALGLSGVLRLNAALFHLLASHGDEISGGMRVDDFLARAGLQAEPAVIRRLSDRAADAQRLQSIQRAALAGFLLLSVLCFLLLGLL